MMYLEIRKRERSVIRLMFDNIDELIHYLKNQSIIKHVTISDLPLTKKKYIHIKV